MSNISIRYIVYVNDHNHKEDSVDYEMEFSYLKDVVKYVHSLPSVYCCGRVEKLVEKDGDYLSDVIMRF